VEFRIPGGIDPDEKEEAQRGADEDARQELGDIHQLIDIGEPATINGLMKELDIKDRLDGLLWENAMMVIAFHSSPILRT
jgi:hypothetical protein